MKSEDPVVAALKILAEEDRSREASPEVHARVMSAFRRKQVVRRWPWAAIGSVAAAAALVVMFALRTPSAPNVLPADSHHVGPGFQPAAGLPPGVVSSTTIPERRAEARRRAKSPAPQGPENAVEQQVEAAPEPPSEITTEFFPLVEIAPPLERAELWRVVVPASTMRSVGLPVREERLQDRVEADLVVGQEGIARAIRFVSYKQ